jgi:hypothetical protein
MILIYNYETEITPNPHILPTLHLRAE